MKKIIKLKYLILLVIVLVSFSSCNNFKEYEQQETDQIATYLAANPLRNFEKKPSGLYYSEATAGTGIQPIKHDTVFFSFTVSFLDGTVLNSSGSDTAIVPIMEGFLIKGLDEGITYMKTGGRSFLLVPSNLAYGSSGYYTYDATGNYVGVPGFTPLLFDVSLLRVKTSAIRK